MQPGVREARESDVGRIHQLVLDLARYERAPDEVRATPEQLRAALFGPQPATYALVAEAGGEVVGFALYFLNFSTWEGVHGIYLEDLYVMPEHRGTGLGKAMLTSLAQIAIRARLRARRVVGLELERAVDRLLPSPRCGADGWMDGLSTHGRRIARRRKALDRPQPRAIRPRPGSGSDPPGSLGPWWWTG